MSDDSFCISILFLCAVVPLARNSTFWTGWNRVDRACAQSYKAGSRSQLRETLLTGMPLIFFTASMFDEIWTWILDLDSGCRLCTGSRSHANIQVY